ncbi:MAG: twin-arginine translocation signal domain-containing protein, partial [Bacteroidales bacterium]|nr:twin-arginine translocation signal domain-containing protein [Bacteroidales bacterium]
MKRRKFLTVCGLACALLGAGFAQDIRPEDAPAGNPSDSTTRDAAIVEAIQE